VTITSQTLYLSHPWGPNCPPYGGQGSIELIPQKQIAKGDPSNSLFLKASNHIGTHIDAPLHFVKDGPSIDSYPAQFWTFNHPLLLDIPFGIDSPSKIITAEMLEDQFKKIGAGPWDLLLIRTGFENVRQERIYWENGPGLGLGLRPLIKRLAPDCRAIGIDSISITNFQNRELGRSVHRELLGGPEPLLLIEDMTLQQASRQMKKVIALPLRIENGDGAPITIIAEVGPP
jgi:arylformamidase